MQELWTFCLGVPETSAVRAARRPCQRERTYLHTRRLPRVRQNRAMTEVGARYVPDGTVQ